MHELIRASAGSGKTFRLSGHFLEQLFAGHPPESILATTFTRKAAGEILGRVLLRLAAAVKDPAKCTELAEFLPHVPVTQERCEELLRDVTSRLHRVRVLTLDSFFQQVARSLTMELGLPSGWGLMDEYTERELRQQAIDAVLAQQIPRDAQRLMQMLAKGHSRRSVRDLIDSTVQNFHELYQSTDRDAWHQIPRPPRLTQKEITAARRDIAAETVYDDKRVIKAVREDMDRFDAGRWEDFISKGIAKKVVTGDHSYYRKPLPGGLVEAYEPLVQHARAETLDIVARQTQATWELIRRFDTEYTRLRMEHGLMGFSDVTRMLSKSSDTASSRMDFRLDSSIRHLLLDEFQDTSLEQWKILERIAQNVTSNEQSSFFCVGDPKQAIYGWRGGVAEILDTVEQTIAHINATSLDVSRRSSVPVMETVNRVFRHLSEHKNLNEHASACAAWQRQFPSHTAFRKELPGYVALQTSPEFEGENADERRAPFLRWTAERIRDLYTEAPGAEIGVLTRTNRTVGRLVHELNLLGVPASEEGGTAPTDSPVVLAVMSLLQLSSHPGCRISRFHVATSPLAGLVELTDWDDDAAAARTASEIRCRLMDNGYGRTLQWISEGIRPACSARDQMRLQQVVAEGWRFDAMPSLNPADFVTVLEDSRLSQSAVAPVRVMTVHQSKGLEFDITVLPELDRPIFQTPGAAAGKPSPAQAPDRVCLWRNQSIRDLLPKPLQNAFQETSSRFVSEALCLLYVAMTRARHAMHLLIPPVATDKTPSSYAGLLVAALIEGKLAPPDQSPYECGSPDWFTSVPEFTRTRQAAVPTTRHTSKLQLAAMSERCRGLRRETPSRHDSGVSLVVRSNLSGGRTSSIDPRLRGTIIHAWFEQIHWLEDRDEFSDEDLSQVLTEHYVNGDQAAELRRDFRLYLSQPETRKILNRQQASGGVTFSHLGGELQAGQTELLVCNERPFVIAHHGAIVQGTIDRLVLAKQGDVPVAADIVDFKTDALGSIDRQQWIDEKKQAYRSQVEIYRSAVHRCFGVPEDRITAHLVLLEADTVVSPLTDDA